MTQSEIGMSPRFVARMASLFYLLNIATIFLAKFFFADFLFLTTRWRLEESRRASMAISVRLCFRALFNRLLSWMAAFLYHLLSPVNKSLSLVAAFCRLVACGMFVVNDLFQIASLHAAGAGSQPLGQLLSAFRADSSSIGIVFFAFHFVVIGYLIFKSYFLPRFLSGLLIFAGFGALTFLVPSFGRSIFLYFAPVSLIAELSLTVWLLAKGVNVQRWHEQQAEAAVSLGT